MQSDPLNLRSEKDFRSKLTSSFCQVQVLKRTAGRVSEKPCWDLCVTNRVLVEKYCESVSLNTIKTRQQIWSLAHQFANLNMYKKVHCCL